MWKTEPVALSTEPRIERQVTPWEVAALGACWLVAVAALLLCVTPPRGLVPLWICLPLLAALVFATKRATRRHDLGGFVQRNGGAVAGIGWSLFALMAVANFPLVGVLLFDLAAYALIAAAGLCALVVALFTIRRTAQSIVGLAAILMVCVAMVTSVETIATTGLSLRTRIMESQYERTIEEVTAWGPGAVAERKDVLADPGPPQRVFWIWWVGVLDNVGGVMHDPSRTAHQASTALTTEPGMVSTCTHLHDSWYYCAFN
jgi:hypothetical protein